MQHTDHVTYHVTPLLVNTEMSHFSKDQLLAGLVLKGPHSNKGQTDEVQ